MAKLDGVNPETGHALGCPCCSGDDVYLGDVLRAAGPLGDAADFNATFPATSEGPGLPDLAEPGETIRGKDVLPLGTNTPGMVNWQIDAGVEIAPHKGVITYAFLDSAHATGIYNNPNQGFTEQFGYSPFTEAQRVAGRQAIQNWDELVAPTFQEVNGHGGADIVMANTSTGPAQAWAYYPYNYNWPAYNHLMSDTWIADPRVNSSNGQLDPGFYGLQTLNHELGHTLGLSHPGAYNFGDDQDGDGEPDPITYEGDAFYFQDSHQYTIMSYFDSFETGAQPVDWNTLRLVYPSTPMVHDVFVIQEKYGADMTTRTGDTTYGFNATDDVTNEAMDFKVGDMATIFTIWDAGGNDTLDLSGYYTDSVIDLREGAYSSAGGWGAYDPALLAIDPGAIGAEAALALINANNAAAGLGPRSLPADHPLGADYFYRLYFEGNVPALDAAGEPILDEEGNPVYLNEGLSWKEITGTGDQYLMEDNIGIAYGAVVENAIGGHGDDQINGNQVDNMLTGGAGADTFVFAADDSVDTITDFESGVDTIDLTELGITADDVTIDGENIFADTGDLVVHIVTQDQQALITDFVF